MNVDAAESADSPRAQGYRWPAEWEPHAATWLSWPHNVETWPGRLPQVEAAFVEIVRALLPHEAVHINVQDAAAETRVRALLRDAGADGPGLRLFQIPTDDAWVRDHGPVFVTRSGPASAESEDPAPGEVAMVDFGFNAWGGKYPPWDRDNAVPAAVAQATGMPRFDAGCVLEGGSIDGDGAGTILTTESCLLADARRLSGEPVRTRESAERMLGAMLGARRVIWLADGIEGDDTDGHVDDFARFVAPGRVVCALEEDKADANHSPLRDARARLEASSDALGRPLEVIALPMPPRLECDGHRSPASYANFYLANEVALVPTFGASTDEIALETLAGCLPDRAMVPIDSRDLVIGLGSIHCLTQQVPRGR